MMTGTRITWRHSDGTELVGVVVSRFGNRRLINVRADRGTDHVVGEWICKAIGERGDSSTVASSAFWRAYAHVR